MLFFILLRYIFMYEMIIILSVWGNEMIMENI